MRSIAKHRYFKGKTAQTTLRRYINYLAHRQANRAGTDERVFFDDKSNKIAPENVQEVLTRNTNASVLGHELVLSPGIQNVDAQRYARELMRKLEASFGYRLSWMAIEHKGEHNHIHVLIEGEAHGKRVRFGREHYLRLREWGDDYLNRVHKFDRYLADEINLRTPYQRDTGDCLFESLFENPVAKEMAVEPVVEVKPTPFQSWSKEKAIAELPDEEKLYEGGAVYTKFSPAEELYKLQWRLNRPGSLPATEAMRDQLKQWIADKRDFGCDHYERLAREKHARQKTRDGPSKKASKAKPISKRTSPAKQKELEGAKPMTTGNNLRQHSGPNWSPSEREQMEKELQEREKQVFLKQVEEDVARNQMRQKEDEVFRNINEKRDEFLEQLSSENPDFKEWADEARRMSEEQEQKRIDERNAYDQRLDEERREEERVRREEFEQEKIEQDRQRELNAQREDEERARHDERIEQERRDEDERLAQIRAEEEDWRKTEAQIEEDRLAEQEREERYRTELDAKYDDDQGRQKEYDLVEKEHGQENRIVKEQQIREMKLDQEAHARQSANDCKSTLSRFATRDDRNSLRFERRPFRQRVHEEKGRQLQWHIRYQNAEARMRLNQQLEAETNADRKESIREQLAELNKGEQEQLETEIEAIDLDAIAAEYERQDSDEPRHGIKQLDEIMEPLADPTDLSKQWRSPLPGNAKERDDVLDFNPQQKANQEQADTSAAVGTSHDRLSNEIFKDQSFGTMVDRYAEENWNQFTPIDDRLDDELSRFLDFEQKDRVLDRMSTQSVKHQEKADQVSRLPEVKIVKQEIKREDDGIFGR